MRDAVGYLAVDARFRGLAFEALAVVMTKLVNCFGVERYFAGGQDINRFDMVA